MAQSFTDFITEEIEPDIQKYRAVVISTEHGDKGKTADRMTEEAKKLGIEMYVVPMRGTYIFSEDGKITIHRDDDEKGFEISQDDTDTADTVSAIEGSPFEVKTA